MRSNGRLKILIALCLIGSLVGAVGAAFISSGNNELEDLGLPVHRTGLLVMLAGFGGLLILGSNNRKQTRKLFHWSVAADQIVVRPASPEEMLSIATKLEMNQVSANSIEPSDFTSLARQSKERIRCVRILSQSPSLESLEQLAALPNLCVVDLQSCLSLSSQAIAGLESLEQIECIILPTGIDPGLFKRLRISLPEVLFHEGTLLQLPSQ